MSRALVAVADEDALLLVPDSTRDYIRVHIIICGYAREM